MADEAFLQFICPSHQSLYKFERHRFHSEQRVHRCTCNGAKRTCLLGRRPFVRCGQIANYIANSDDVNDDFATVGMQSAKSDQARFDQQCLAAAISLPIDHPSIFEDNSLRHANPLIRSFKRRLLHAGIVLSVFRAVNRAAGNTLAINPPSQWRYKRAIERIYMFIFSFGVSIAAAVKTSCSAWAFFEPVIEKISMGEDIELIDSRYRVNNPTLYVIAEAV